MADLLVARGVTKRFGGLVAVNSVDFTIQERAIVSLIGPNGAGKTTFFNMIAGLYTPTDGQITFGTKNITGRKPHLITQLGIARTEMEIIWDHGAVPAPVSISSGFEMLTGS